MKRVGFIGVGVMGEPMCRHLAVKSGLQVAAYDRDGEPLQRLAGHGVSIARSVREAAGGADVVFLCLPSGEAVDAVARADEGLLAVVKPGQIVVDLSTSSGSADSFALRNHGMKAVLEDDVPLRAFSVEYARKDLNYAIELARNAGVDTLGAEKVKQLLSKASDAGWGDQYWPVVNRLIAGEDG